MQERPVSDPGEEPELEVPSAPSPRAPVRAPVVRAELRDVVVDFPDPAGGAPKRVLDHVSLQVTEGEFVVLVGKSGCGKTTMLNLLAGIISATAGEVEVLGKAARSARRDVGYMFARDALLPWRNALRNVEYGLELRGIPRAQRKETARTYLEMVHLREAAELWPWQLSQGMRQRVALARTWALEPALLLMDEPFAALDAQTRESVQYEFIRLWEEHRRSVVFVTHDLAEAIALGDRVLMIGNGRVLRDVTVPFGRPRDLGALSTEPEFQNLRRELRHLL